MSKRSIVNSEIVKKNQAPKPNESLDDLLMGGQLEDIEETNYIIPPYQDTPYAHQMTSSLYGRVGIKFKKLLFAQLNCHIGMSNFGEKYFALPLQSNFELMTGIMLEKYIFGVTAGFERGWYQNRLIQTQTSRKNAEITVASEAIIADIIQSGNPTRFSNLYGTWSGFCGIFWGYKIMPSWRSIIRLQAVFPLQSEEKSPINYAMRYKYERSDINYTYEAKHKIKYNMGMRVTAGVEWTHTFQITTKGE